MLRRVEAKDTWNASVQVRQKTSQRKTLYFLEQILLKYDATKDCVGVQGNHDGLDFFFGFEPYARKLVDFLHPLIVCLYAVDRGHILEIQSHN